MPSRTIFLSALLLLVSSVALFGCPDRGGGGESGESGGEDDRHRVPGTWNATSVLYAYGESALILGEVVFYEDGVAVWYMLSLREDVAPEILHWSENSGVIRVTGTNNYLFEDGDTSRLVRSTTLTFEGPKVMTGESLMTIWRNDSFLETVDWTEELVRAE